MPIIIERLEKLRTGRDLYTYRLRINNDELCLFKHRRSKRLAECLRAAADELDRQENRMFGKVVRLLRA